jgi:hypothetical protein
MGQAVVDGLFGVSVRGKEVRLTPRLDDLAGGIRVYEPSTDVFAAFEYQPTDTRESLQYGSNSPTALAINLPVRWSGDTRARLDGKDWLTISYGRSGPRLLGQVIVPSGSHKVELFRVPSGRRKF